jgi:hypothetical protein
VESVAVRPLKQVLGWMAGAVLGSGLIVGLLALVPLPIPPVIFLAIHSVLAVGVVCTIAYVFCLRPFFRKVQELQRRSEEIDRIRHELQTRTAGRVKR